MIQYSLYSEVFQHNQRLLHGVHTEFKTVNVKMDYIYEFKNFHVK